MTNDKSSVVISVIVPVHNTPSLYLRRCLESIRKSDYKDYEVLVIDDGSKQQECLQCLQELCRTDNKVELLHQSAEGVSVARNLGIEKATGEFLAFVDSDDEISPHFFSHAVRMAQKYSLDIVFGSIKYVPDVNGLGIQGSRKECVLTGKEILNVKKSILEVRHALDGNDAPVLGSPCGRLYRTSIAKQIRFPKDIRICEDQLFNLYMLDACKRVGIVPEFWYLYYQNEFSALHRIRERKVFYPYYKCLAEYGKQQESKDIQDAINNKVIGFMTGLAGDIARGEGTFWEKMEKIRETAQIPIFSHAISALDVDSKVLSKAHCIRVLFLKKKMFFLLYLFQRICR